MSDLFVAVYIAILIVGGCFALNYLACFLQAIIEARMEREKEMEEWRKESNMRYKAIIGRYNDMMK